MAVANICYHMSIPVANEKTCYPCYHKFRALLNERRSIKGFQFNCRSIRAGALVLNPGRIAEGSMFCLHLGIHKQNLRKMLGSHYHKDALFISISLNNRKNPFKILILKGCSAPPRPLPPSILLSADNGKKFLPYCIVLLLGIIIHKRRVLYLVVN